MSQNLKEQSAEFIPPLNSSEIISGVLVEKFLNEEEVGARLQNSPLHQILGIDKEDLNNIYKRYSQGPPEFVPKIISPNLIVMEKKEKDDA